MKIDFSAKIWFWQGPAPWYFVTVPEESYSVLKEMAAAVTYGWGMIPAKVLIGKTEWETSLFHKDNSYVVPIKANVRKSENIDEGDLVTVRLEIS